jgi:hypothetical protein
MTQGWVRSDWAAHHHLKWLRSLAERPTPPRFDGLRTVLQVVLGSAAALFAARVLFFAIGANTTDKVTGWLYDVTAWPGVASVTPQTAVHRADWPALGYLVLVILAWMVVDRMRRLRPAGTASAG